MSAIVIFGLIQQRLNPRLGETPRASIKRFFLGPHNSFGIGVLIQVLFELGPREGVELLDAGDGHGIKFVLSAVFVEGGVDLARAEDDAVNFVVGSDGVVGVGRVGNYPLEVGVACEVFDGRAGEGVAEEGFREEEDQS